MDTSSLSPEILRNVCEHMGRAELFSMALTSRGFLEPALDSLWRDLHSFIPFISCLPADLWNIRDNPGPFEGRTTQVLHPRRMATPKDMDRYLSFYAPRIRSLRPHLVGNEMTLSIEAFQAIRLATGGKDGVLSPLLTNFYWPSPDVARYSLGEEFTKLLSPYMSLFLGSMITTLHFPAPTDTPLHAGSLDQALRRYPRLRSLVIQGSGSGVDREFIERCITSFPWEDLEHVSVPFITNPIIRHLARLPRLRKLVIHDSAEDSPVTIVTLPEGASDAFFPALKSFKISGSLPALQALLHCIPPTNAITHIDCMPREDHLSISERQDIIKTITTRCNPSTLTRLILFQDGPDFDSIDNPLDVDLSQEIDISPIFRFRELRELKLWFEDPVRLTPADFAAIPKAFPNIKTLDFGSFMALNFIPPRINHTHLISLLQGCPSLISLKLLFDASGISGEVVPGAPFPLKYLEVNNSPIYSPSQVISFMKVNLPNVTMIYGSESYLEDRNHNPAIFTRRWDRVKDEWGAYRCPRL
ncbi:hypothetical protein DFP72DRAFT_902769 [Ephemerocybe angulata]|uniref:F-box domain-containing protein n=1 Tax=Ephemerocybe angulata TaxID=980116 RepID=A0A8H6HX03_9AGAR|nr:hypothetical protein DFP72DRAFT_902769 [Tulosesus angulatus]